MNMSNKEKKLNSNPNLVFYRYKPKNLTNNQCKFVQKILGKYMLGIFICRKGGDILFSYQIDPTLKIDLISNFIAALSMFGEENVGQIKRIFIEGLNVEMNIVSKHDLILVSFFRPNMVKDHLREESEKTLEKFYSIFKEQIEQGKTNLSIYLKFDDEMCQIVLGYLKRIGVFKEEKK